MVKYQLLWGVYVQWTRSYDTEDEAIKEAREYARKKEAPLSQFTLLKLSQVPLEGKTSGG